MGSGLCALGLRDSSAEEAKRPRGEDAVPEGGDAASRATTRSSGSALSTPREALPSPRISPRGLTRYGRSIFDEFSTLAPSVVQAVLEEMTDASGAEVRKMLSELMRHAELSRARTGRVQTVGSMTDGDDTDSSSSTDESNTSSESSSTSTSTSSSSSPSLTSLIHRRSTAGVNRLAEAIQSSRSRARQSLESILTELDFDDTAGIPVLAPPRPPPPLPPPLPPQPLSPLSPPPRLPALFQPVPENTSPSPERMASRKSQTEDDPKEVLLCRICYANQRDTVVIPCNHLHLCYHCASQVRECPICRSLIHKLIKVYL
eukprot:Sspe_Gene.38555::Locus_18583_Transcript_1_1_Confidence_1.000_Length_1131::g.38555::m.38555